MNIKIKLVCACLLAILVLGTFSLACSNTRVTVTAPAVTKAVTQTLTATGYVTSTITTVNPVLVTATITTPPLTVSTTIVAPTITTTRPPVTVTQYWPPVTKYNPNAYNYYLPSLTKGQTVNFTLKIDGAPLTYWVRDPTYTNVILTGKVDSSGTGGSGSFTALLDGVYTIECVATEGLASFTLFFTIT